MVTEGIEVLVSLLVGSMLLEGLAFLDAVDVPSVPLFLLVAGLVVATECSVVACLVEATVYLVVAGSFVATVCLALACSVVAAVCAVVAGLVEATVCSVMTCLVVATVFNVAVETTVRECSYRCC